MQTKRVSIKDIAQAAGVSHPTVSRALRGRGRMSESTRARIVTIAEEMGYASRLGGAMPPSQRSRVIGLMVTQFADPFDIAVARGIEDEAHRHDYGLIMVSASIDPEREMQTVRELQSRRVDGVIISSSRVGGRYTEILDEIDTPIVLINNHAGGENVHSVAHDDYGGARQLAEYLWRQGYRRIAFLGNGRAGRAQSERQRGWSDAMLLANSMIDVIAFGPSGRMAGGAAGAEKLLELAHFRWGKRPDAICCYNDAMAIGAMSVLHQHGLEIPADVAITGFDDIEMASYTHPPLTTLHQPRYEMGVQAMKIMMQVLDKTRRPKEPIAMSMPGQLIIRASA